MTVAPQELLLGPLDGVLEFPSILEIDRLATAACTEGVENDIPGNFVWVEFIFLKIFFCDGKFRKAVGVMFLLTLDVLSENVFDGRHEPTPLFLVCIFLTTTYRVREPSFRDDSSIIEK